MVKRQEHPHYFFDKDEKEKITEAIREAEKNTTGKILIHLARRSRGDVMATAKKIFERHRLHRQKHRNSILIYVALADHAFAILGDDGIHRHLGEDFWKKLAESMQSYFSRHEFLKGLKYVIHKAGEKLKKHFPL